eukprot:Phypoly_transcript_21876.p1 GENE.Phypoly_transcript_21876~~Phypoly_transcript_21876.p1  ORF type:complete len:123 (+),score=10.76 Phypoly_transcript_21876:173-541(+)
MSDPNHPNLDPTAVYIGSRFEGCLSRMAFESGIATPPLYITIKDGEGHILEYLVTPPGCRYEQFVFRDLERRGINKEELVISISATKVECIKPSEGNKLIATYHLQRMTFLSQTNQATTATS